MPMIPRYQCHYLSAGKKENVGKLVLEHSAGFTTQDQCQAFAPVVNAELEQYQSPCCANRVQLIQVRSKQLLNMYINILTFGSVTPNPKETKTSDAPDTKETKTSDNKIVSGGSLSVDDTENAY